MKRLTTLLALIAGAALAQDESITNNVFAPKPVAVRVSSVAEVDLAMRTVALRATWIGADGKAVRVDSSDTVVASIPLASWLNSLNYTGTVAQAVTTLDRVNTRRVRRVVEGAEQ